MLLVLVGCQGKVFYLPSVDLAESTWPQEGRTADGRAFADWELDPPLHLLWQQKIDAATLGGMIFSGHLALQLTTGPTVYAFDRYTGKLMGKRSMDVEICAPLVLVDGVLVYAELGKKPGLRALDGRTHALRWSYPGVVCAPLIARHDTLLVAGERGKLSVLRSRSGEELWHKQVGRRLRTAPGLGGEVVYVGTADGSFMALDLESGEERWKQELESGVRTRAVVGEDRVFTGTAGGVVYALRADSGQVVWQTHLGALLTPGLALAPQVLAVGSVDHHLYGLDPETGEVLWRFETGGVVRGTPAATVRTVYCGSSDGYVYALENETGQLQWKYRVDGPILAPVAVGERAIAITSENKTVYVFGRL